MATSTTGMRTIPTAASRLSQAARIYQRIALSGRGGEQGTESHASSGKEGANNRPAMQEPLREGDVACCPRGASFEELWEAAIKCRRNSVWKPSVKQYCNNIALESLNASRKLRDGTWVDGKPKPIAITYPKKREGLSIRFRDRVVQRALNDNVIYPELVWHFVAANCACQKGKGIDYARRLTWRCLHRNYLHYSHDFYILTADVTGYYPNMRHDVVHDLFARYFDMGVTKRVDSILSAHGGTTGYHPGSQIVQIAGISLLNDLDHYIKEALGARDYVRVMDDFFIASPSREFLETCLGVIRERLGRLGLSLSPSKTRIFPATESFSWLGFVYRPSFSHEFYLTAKGESVKHERKKLARLRKVACKEKADECLTSYLAHLDYGDCRRLQYRLKRYNEELWRTA